MENRALNPKIVQSADGSHTLRVEELKEHYHSHKGAIQESRYVFLQMGLDLFKESADIRILEVGFGTGLNALLTAIQKQRGRVHYTTLETFPLSSDLISELNYPELLKAENARELFVSIHDAPWEQDVHVCDDFILIKKNCPVQFFDSELGFDLVYYDAFAPHAQPELWGPDIWERLYSMVNSNGVLVTYCAKGQVRRDMQAAGFKVERLPGPPGKREMLRARR